MADNAPAPEDAPQPSAPHTAPPLKKDAAGKVVVTLASVAKAPPAKTQAITHVAPPSSTPKEVPMRASLQVVAPPPLPAKPTVEGKLQRPGGGGEVKQLSKTVALRGSLSSSAPPVPKPIAPAPVPVTPPPEAKSTDVPSPPDVSAKPAIVESKSAPSGGEVKALSKTVTLKGSLSSSTPAPVPPAPEVKPAEAKSDDLVPVPAGWTPKKATPFKPEEASNAPKKLSVRKTTARLFIPPIKLNEPVPEPEPEELAPGESILLGPGDSVQEKPTRPQPKVVEKPTISPQPAIEAKSVEPEKPAEPAIPAPPVALPQAQPLVILPPVGAAPSASTILQPPVLLAEPKPEPVERTQVRPPPLPKPAEKPPATGLQIAPPMAVTDPVAPEEKRRPPQLPSPVNREGEHVVSAPTEAPEPTNLHKAPAMVQKESMATTTPAPVLPSQPGAPTTSPIWTVAGPVAPRETPKPILPVATTKAIQPAIDSLAKKATGRLLPKPEENKPALRPPVLPNKSLIALKATELEALALPVTEKAPPPLTVAPEIVVPASKTAEPGKHHAPVELPSKLQGRSEMPPVEAKVLPLTRAERAKKRRLVEMVVFYVFLLVVCGLLYVGTIRFSQETRVEGQVIPPMGMPLADEVWIVSDFRQLTAGIAEDLSEERAPLMQEMHERQDHVQRVQADLAMRDERIRLLQGKIQAAKDEQSQVVKTAHDQAQELWDGPGVQLDDEYNARRISLQNAIVSRAKSLNLKYAPDPTYNAPEVWANSYRLALYEVPAGVDSTKEYQWLADQMKQWRDFVKSQDDQREQLRQQAAQIKQSPAAKLTELNQKVEELQHRIDNALAEEEPLKPELQQAQASYAEAQTEEMGLDAKYYKQLNGLPNASVTKRLLLDTNGRFSWLSLQNDSPFAEGEKEHRYWIFARATRKDGREYWALGRFSIAKDHTIGLLIEPNTFVSTKAMLRPDLSPDELEQ